MTNAVGVTGQRTRAQPRAAKRAATTGRQDRGITEYRNCGKKEKKRELEETPSATQAGRKSTGGGSIASAVANGCQERNSEKNNTGATNPRQHGTLEAPVRKAGDEKIV